MPEKLKDIFYADTFLDRLSDSLHENYEPFDQAAFLSCVHTPDWPEKALKQKMIHLTTCLHAALPPEYPQALAILQKIAPAFPSFEAISFSYYAARYGLDEPDISLPALRFFTRFMTAEFAIRPFLRRYPQKTLAFAYACAEDEDEGVRRLASEGTRPRLPWAEALPAFQKDPTPILPILEKLHADPSETVRRSVANNLNDIAKDHPDIVLTICERWLGESPEVDRLVKHACRTLLKKGNVRALRLFGFGDPVAIKIAHLAFDPPVLPIGADLYINFELLVETAEPCQVRLEYAIDFIKARGQSSAKVFQIKEVTLAPGSHPVQKKHSFQDRTTRTHYPGPHTITILVNGLPQASGEVQLTPGD